MYLCVDLSKDFLISDLSHIGSVLIGIEYGNCHRSLDVYLLVAISIGQIQSKPIYKLVTLVTSTLSNFD